MKKKKVPLILKIFLVLLVVLPLAFVLFALYISAYADQTAMDAMRGGDGVTVREIPEGWLFDGPSEDTAFVFYTGFRIEETAYAPLLLLVARESADVFLVKMPLLTATFGQNKAGELREAYSYARWYVGGHSLGGDAAALYAASAQTPPDGLILLAAPLVDNMGIQSPTLALYGSKDKVIRTSLFDAMSSFLPEGSRVHCIEGGNHGQFGSYGPQAGDGPADITPQAQWRETADCIRDFIA